jgi:hypothetical protein
MMPIITQEEDAHINAVWSVFYLSDAHISEITQDILLTANIKIYASQFLQQQAIKPWNT